MLQAYPPSGTKVPRGFNIESGLVSEILANLQTDLSRTVIDAKVAESCLVREPVINNPVIAIAEGLEIFLVPDIIDAQIHLPCLRLPANDGVTNVPGGQKV